MGKKPIVSVTYENERISIKNSSRCLKCVLCQLTLLKMCACIRHVSVSADTIKRIPYTRVSVRFTLAETANCCHVSAARKFRGYSIIR